MLITKVIFYLFLNTFFVFILGRTGTVSNFSMNYGRSSATSSSTVNSRTQEEFRFHDERVRGDNRKRANSSSSMDVSMDLSPSRKRGRFL